MDQKAPAVKDPIYRIRRSATHLAHPQAVRARSDARDLDSSCFQIYEEQNEKAGQSFTCPDFNGEKVRRNDRVPMALEEIFPRCF